MATERLPASLTAAPTESIGLLYQGHIHVNAMLLPVSVADIYNIFLDQNFNK
jgi:hypothetical protein